MRLPLLLRTSSAWSRRGIAAKWNGWPGTCRVLTTKQDSENDETTTKTSQTSSSSTSYMVQQWRDPSLKGIGQVIFLNDIKAGAMILGSLAIGDAYLASLAALGSVAANGVAHGVQLEPTPQHAGLWQYNGCLMGCVSAVFVAPHSALLGVASTLTGASLATLVTAVLPKALGNSMPQWTFAFNIVALTQLVRVQPLKLDPDVVAVAAETTTTATSISMSSILTTPLVGISQIFVVENAWTGVGIVAAIASYSPLLAGHAVAGSTVGALTGLALGLPAADVAAGLCGFNSALTSMGVAVFFQHSPVTVALSLGGAAAAAATFAGFKEVFFNLGASPCLTLPFCVTMTGCYLLAGPVPSLVLAKNPHSPEKNGE